MAMKLEDAKADLEEIGKLSGKKVIIRGNHDYWWTSLAKVRKRFLQAFIAYRMTL